ncbi:MAG: hypothetical protein ACRDYX_23565, partial [Egibacteraceae bacterium]
MTRSTSRCCSRAIGWCSGRRGSPHHAGDRFQPGGIRWNRAPADGPAESVRLLEALLAETEQEPGLIRATLRQARDRAVPHAQRGWTGGGRFRCDGARSRSVGRSSGEDPGAVDEGERIACGERGQAKPAPAFFLVRGPLAYGDRRARRAPGAAAGGSSRRG